MSEQIQAHLLNQMMPRAVLWAQRQEEFVRRQSNAPALSIEWQERARRAGIQHPEAVRLWPVREIPLPEEADLRKAAGALGLVTSGTAGLTIGYAIFVRQDCLKDPKLIAHELMHVAQYERLRGIAVFLQKYLAEVNNFGYPAAPMEREAIAFAEKEFP